MRLILCSGSPRRRELMAQMGLEFILDKETSYIEDMPTLLSQYKDPQEVCRQLSLGKSLGFHRPLEADEILISADTLVSMNGEVFGKPHNEATAREMLRTLAGGRHCVTTALTLRSASKTVSRLSNAYVTFAPLSEDEINYYISNYSPLDKAGAYGIQEWIGLIAATSIEGSFYTIMGLDTAALYSALKEF